jgi:hypothetical protein
MSGAVCTACHTDNVSQRKFLIHATKQTRSTYYYDAASLPLQKALLLIETGLSCERGACHATFAS